MSQEWAISRDWCQVLHPLHVFIVFCRWSFIVSKKHVELPELPGRNLVQLRDRRAVGNNWREDFIQDGWSLRISKSPVFVAVFLQVLHNISVCGCIFIPYQYATYLHRCWNFVLPFRMYLSFPCTGESIGKARGCSKGSADCERHQGSLVLQLFKDLCCLLQLLSGADRCFSAIFAHCCILTIFQCLSRHFNALALVLGVFLILDSGITPLFDGSEFQKWVLDIPGRFAF